MKITHNSNNHWKDEAKAMGLDKDYIKWMEKVIEDEITECLGDIWLCRECKKHNKDTFDSYNLF